MDYKIIILFYSALGLLASYQDIKKREVSNLIPILIILISLPIISTSKILTCIVIFTLFLIPNLIKEASIGGADIKFMATSALILGIKNILVGSLVGLISAIIITTIRNTRKKDEEKTIALIPYLYFGCMVALLTSFI